MQNFSQSKNKLRYVYLLMPAGTAEKSKLTAEFLRRKVAEYETLQAQIEALKAEMNSVKESLSENHHCWSGYVGLSYDVIMA